MKKLFIFLLLGIFLISIVSAADWDNVLDYSNDDLKVSISNSFLLLFKTSEIGTAELKSHPSVNYVKKVGTGNQIVMWYDFDFLGLYENGLGNVEFTDVRTGKLIDRNYSFVYWGEKERDIYETNCYVIGKSVNGTVIEECESVVVGKETYNDWLPYNSKDIPKGNIRIGLMTYVEIDDKVDGVWTIAGKKVKKHAVWTAELAVDLVSYWNFDELSGDLLDVHGTNDGTLYGPDQGVAGIINTAYDFEDGDTDYILNDAVTTEIIDNDFTINMWVKPENVVSTDYLFGHNEIGDVNPVMTINILDADKANIYLRNNTGEGLLALDSGAGTIGAGIWSMITYTKSGTNVSVWVNGTYISSGVYSAGTWSDVDRQCFGVDCGGLSTGPYDGIIDETGVWNRSLTSAEVAQLYNSGTGITYTVTQLEITLLSPEDTANFTTNNISFSANVSDTKKVGIQNVTLEVFNSTDLVFNETNTSGFEGVYNWNDTTLSDEDYDWNVTAYDDANASYSSSTRSFSIDTSPTISVFSPTSSNYSTSTIWFNATSDLSIDTWVINYNGTNHTLPSINSTAEVEDGNFNLEFWGNNSVSGVWGLNDSISFNVDATNPEINVSYPNETITFHEKNINLSLNWTVTDTNLDSCWYNWDGTNVSVTCGDNSTSFNITDGTNKNLIFYANDTLGNLGSNLTTWEYRLFLEQEIFDSTIVEGSDSTFSANFLTNGSDITIAVLYYNETTNTGTISEHGGNNFTISNIITIPSVSADANISFYWNITQGLLNFALDPKNQTVLNLGIDDCSVFTTLIFNYTIVDEEKQDFLEDPFNTTLELDLNLFSLDKSRLISSFSKSYGDTNPATVCVNINLTNATMFSLDSIVRYEALNHTNEYYNLQGFTLKNSTIPQVITLFSLLSEDSTEFQITFKDSNFAVVENALIQINRQYISEGVFKTVEIPKTDANGQTVAHLVEKEVIYNLIVIKDNVILGTFNNVIAFCQDAFIGNCFIYLNAIKAGTVIFDYDEEIGLAFSFSYNESSRLLQFPFTTLDGGVKNVSLLAIKLDQLGNTTACSQSLVTSSGTISCPVPVSIGNATLIVEIFVEGDLRITNYIQTGTPFDLGDIGYFLMFFLVLSLALMMTQSKIAVVLGVVLGFISSTLLSFVKGGILAIGSSITWLIIMAIILIWKLNSQAQT